MSFAFFQKKRVLEDPFFGTLKFVERGGFWEGKMILAGSKEPVDVLIDADHEGPSEAHRQVARNFSAKLDSVKNRIGGLVPGKWEIVGFDLQDAAIPLIELTIETNDGEVKSIAVKGDAAHPDISIVTPE